MLRSKETTAVGIPPVNPITAFIPRKATKTSRHLCDLPIPVSDVKCRECRGAYQMPVIRRKLTPGPEPEVSKRGYNIHAAAVYIGLSKFRIYELVKAGKLRPVEIGKGRNPAFLFDKIDLDRYMDELFLVRPSFLGKSLS